MEKKSKNLLFSMSLRRCRFFVRHLVVLLVCIICVDVKFYFLFLSFHFSLFTFVIRSILMYAMCELHFHDNENISFLQLSTHLKLVAMFLFAYLFNITSKVCLHFTCIGLIFYFPKRSCWTCMFTASLFVSFSSKWNAVWSWDVMFNYLQWLIKTACSFWNNRWKPIIWYTQNFQGWKILVCMIWEWLLIFLALKICNVTISLVSIHSTLKKVT